MDFATWRRPGPLETNFMGLLQRAMKGKLFPDIIHHWERVEMEQRAMITCDWMMTSYTDILFRMRGGKRSLDEEKSRKRREITQNAVHSMASTGLVTVAAMQGMQDHFFWLAPRAEQHRKKQQETYEAFLQQRRVLARRFEATKLLQRVGRGKLWRVLLHVSRVTARDGLTTRSQEWEGAFKDLIAARSLVASQFYKDQINGSAIAFVQAGLSEERTSTRAAQKYLQERQGRKQQRQRMVVFLSRCGIEYNDGVLGADDASMVVTNNNNSSNNNTTTGARSSNKNSPRRKAALAAAVAKKESERQAVTAFLAADPCSQVVPLQPAPWNFAVLVAEADERARLIIEFLLAAEQLSRWSIWRGHIRRLVLNQEHVPGSRVEAEMRKVWRTIECESIALSQRSQMQREFLREVNELWRHYRRERAELRDSLIQRGLLPDDGYWDYDENGAPDFSYDNLKDDPAQFHGGRASDRGGAGDNSSEGPGESEGSSLRPIGGGSGGNKSSSIAGTATEDGGGSSLVVAFKPQWGTDRKGGDSTLDDQTIGDESSGGGGGGGDNDNKSTHSMATLNSMDQAHVVNWDQGRLLDGDPLRGGGGGDPTKPPLPDRHHGGGGNNNSSSNPNNPPVMADVLGAAFSRPGSAHNSGNNSRTNSRPPSGKDTPTQQGGGGADLRRNDTMVVAGGGGGGGGGNQLQRNETMVVAGGRGSSAGSAPGGGGSNSLQRNETMVVAGGGGGNQLQRNETMVVAGGGGGGNKLQRNDTMVVAGNPFARSRPNSGNSSTGGGGGGDFTRNDSMVIAGGGGGGANKNRPNSSNLDSNSRNSFRPGGSGTDGDLRVVTSSGDGGGGGGGGSLPSQSITSNPFSRPGSAAVGQQQQQQQRPQTGGSDHSNNDPHRLHAQDSVFAEILEQKRQRMNQRRNNGDDDDDLGGGGGGEEEDEENFDEWSLDSKASIRAGRNYWI